MDLEEFRKANKLRPYYVDVNHLNKDEAYKLYEDLYDKYKIEVLNVLIKILKTLKTLTIIANL